jgi:TPR repeat protein
MLSKNIQAQNRDSQFWLEYNREMAQNGNAAAQYELGMCYFAGNGVLQDYQKAAYWFRQAAQQGDMHAQYAIGACYLEGKGVEADINNAIYWYEQSAINGYVVAQCELGACLIRLKDYESAFIWMYKAAEAGFAKAQYNLGNMYYCGHGVQADFNKFEYWIRKSANQGYADAQIMLGDAYLTVDMNESIRWYRMAADQGNELAKCKISYCESVIRAR